MKDSAFHDYLINEVFAQTPGVSSRAMFGGWGLYQDGVIFALEDNGKIFFKVDEANRTDYENLGSKPFTYQMSNGKTTTLSYWELPEEILENREELIEWVNKAVEASKKSKK